MGDCRSWKLEQKSNECKNSACRAASVPVEERIVDALAIDLALGYLQELRFNE